MTSQWWVDDDRLITALSDALGTARAVPHQFVDAGKNAYRRRTVATALGHEPAGNEALRRPIPAQAELVPLRALMFVTACLTVELALTGEALVGQVVPPEPGTVELALADGRVLTAVVSDLGVFTIRPLPSGAFRLSYHTRHGGGLVTGWVAW